MRRFTADSTLGVKSMRKEGKARTVKAVQETVEFFYGFDTADLSGHVADVFKRVRRKKINNVKNGEEI